MMAGLLTGRDRRALLLGAAVIGGLVLGLKGAPAWLAWRAEAAASAVELGEELARSQAVIAALPAWVDTLEARLGRVRSLGVTFLVARDEAGLEEGLRRQIEDATRRAGARVGSQDYAVEPTGADDVRRVRAELNGLGDVETLALLLAEIEGRPRLLRITELTVRPSDVHAPPQHPEYLELRVVIEAVGLLRDAWQEGPAPGNGEA